VLVVLINLAWLIHIATKIFVSISEKDLVAFHYITVKCRVQLALARNIYSAVMSGCCKCLSALSDMFKGWLCCLLFSAISSEEEQESSSNGIESLFTQGCLMYPQVERLTVSGFQWCCSLDQA
jgi:hypothetical protein